MDPPRVFVRCKGARCQTLGVRVDGSRRVLFCSGGLQVGVDLTVGLLQVFRTCEICCAGGPALNWKWGTSTSLSLQLQRKGNIEIFLRDAVATNHTLLTLLSHRRRRGEYLTNTLTPLSTRTSDRVTTNTLEVNLLVNAPPAAPWLACLTANSPLPTRRT